jgi:transposase
VSQLNRIQYVGVDAHQESLSISVLVEGEGSAQRARKIRNEPAAVRRLFRRLLEQGPVRAVYEAGCTGFVLWRQLTELGVDCLVAAPSRIPVLPGEHRKTDRLDAERLALFLRGEQLTAVTPPTPATEALRTLVRTRDQARKDVVAAKHHITKFLLNRGDIYRGSRSLWCRKHRAWLRAVSMADPDDQQLLEFKLARLATREAELHELDERILERATRDDIRLAVRNLSAFRGVGTLTAVNVVAEIGDARRFANKAAVAAYVGLVPSERSSGSKVRRGSITRAGSRHLRRLLVEVAQHYRSRATESKALTARRMAASATTREQARLAEKRLVKRYRRLSMTKHTNVAKTAIARELIGHLWAAMHPEIGLAR